MLRMTKEERRKRAVVATWLRVWRSLILFDDFCMEPVHSALRAAPRSDTCRKKVQSNMRDGLCKL
jgi:hypothetical protein